MSEENSIIDEAVFSRYISPGEALLKAAADEDYQEVYRLLEDYLPADIGELRAAVRVLAKALGLER